MQIQGDLIVFDNLVRPSEEIVGATRPVQAKVPTFSAANAKGDLREVKDFQDVGAIAHEAGKIFGSVFT